MFIVSLLPFPSLKNIIEYFSTKALNGLRMLVSPATSDEDMEVDESDSTWLLVNIPALPCFSLAYPSIATELRGACEVESDPAIVSLYIR